MILVSACARTDVSDIVQNLPEYIFTGNMGKFSRSFLDFLYFFGMLIWYFCSYVITHSFCRDRRDRYIGAC